MINRLKIAFSQSEYSGLLKLAEVELRQPDSQVRHIVRQELMRLGLLSENQEEFLETPIEGTTNADQS